MKTRQGPAFVIAAVLLLAPRLAAGPSGIAAVSTYGNFETAGIIIRVEGMDFNESAALRYRKTGETSWRQGHDFVRYDGNHMAASLFGLAPSAAYDIEITLADPDGTTGANPALAAVATKPEYALPVPLRVVKVSSQSQLDAAVENALPGDEIRLAAGTYPTGIRILGNGSGTSDHPIAVTSPAAGETWRRGTRYTIRWTKAGEQGAKVRISLLRNGGLKKTIILATPNDGSHEWKVGAGIVRGAGYQIRVKTLKGNIKGFSGAFTID